MAAFNTYSCTVIKAGKTNQIAVIDVGIAIGDFIQVGPDIPRKVTNVTGGGKTITIQGFFGISSPTGVYPRNLKPPAGVPFGCFPISVLKQQKPCPSIEWVPVAGDLCVWSDILGPHGGFTVAVTAAFKVADGVSSWANATGKLDIFKNGQIVGSSGIESSPVSAQMTLSAIVLRDLSRFDELSANGQGVANFADNGTHSGGTRTLGPAFLSTHIVGVD